jgi:hypothetical protein
MQPLESKIRSDLNSYQRQVSDKLQHLKNQGLISEIEYRGIIFDAKITAKAVIEGLSYKHKYTEEATEIYIYSLFDRYKSNINGKIRKIEQKQKQKQIIVNKKQIIVYFEDESGRLIEPSKTDVEIVESYLEEVSTIPVKSLLIIVGCLSRILKLNIVTKDSNLFLKIKAKLNSKKLKKEKHIMESTYQEFGQFISQLVEGNYLEDEKEKYKSKLIHEMRKKVIEKRSPENFAMDKL